MKTQEMNSLFSDNNIAVDAGASSNTEQFANNEPLSDTEMTTANTCTDISLNHEPEATTEISGAQPTEEANSQHIRKKLTDSFVVKRFPLDNAAKTTDMLKGLVDYVGFDVFLVRYNEYRQRYNASPIKDVSLRRYVSMGKGYEEGPPASVLCLARELADELELGFEKTERENFFTAPIEEVLEKVAALPQGPWRSVRASSMIRPVPKHLLKS
jgi:hypothetical protein